MACKMFRQALPFLATLLAILAHPAAAHDSRPLSITIEEQTGHAYRVRLRLPPTIDIDNHPSIDWPAGCHALGDQSSAALFDTGMTVMIGCPRALEGQRIAVHYPVYNPSLATLFRLTRIDGTVLTQLLPPDRTQWQVPARASRGEVARSYMKLGIGHIWGGIDHLLFVAGLLILAGSMRRVLLAITGFTLAHSLTLTLSALGLVRLPIPAVEATIALSILFLAREIARPTPDGLARRYPIAVSSSFGLLHGFGFAAALQEAGLPDGELVTGLLCFNLGVEAGQIIFIALMITLFAGARALIRRRPFALPSLPLSATALAGYALGIPAAFWFIQRLGAAL